MSAMPTNRVLRDLMEGNKRFVDGWLRHPNRTAARRAVIASGQHPVAAILSCADSRVPPEIVFDQGLGDLIVVRVAGNVLGMGGLASLELAVGTLGVRLIMVLGHSGCRAVAAAIDGTDLSPHMTRLAKIVRPAIDDANKDEGDFHDSVGKSNVLRVVKQLARSKPILKEKVEGNELDIIGAFYNLDSGAVEIL